jgi:hypothetical protein
MSIWIMHQQRTPEELIVNAIAVPHITPAATRLEIAIWIAMSLINS